MTYVVPSEFSSFEQALKKFRKKCDKDGILKAVVERKRGFVKPSEKRRSKKRRARFNATKHNESKKRSTTILVHGG
jgi:ribosomal protein S21